MLNRSRELFWALIAIVLIALLYVGVVARMGSIPAAQGFFGHSLGVIGFLLMLMTETLYTLRKRTRSAKWGSMASWLQLHIFTGIVGPFLVMLHTSWKFNGLAGVVFLLTVIIVLSGFIGRYIFTAVPRTVDGAEVQAREIGAQMLVIEAELDRLMSTQPTLTRRLAARLATRPAAQGSSPLTVLGRAFSELADRWNGYREQRTLAAPIRAEVAVLIQLTNQRQTLKRQMESIATARRLMATWYAVHIPIGVALFTTAFVHIVAAIYYATLLH